jgi:hypothetical protein
MASVDTLKARRLLTVGDKSYAYYSLPAAEEAGLSGVSTLPISMKVLLENLLRNEDNDTVTADDLKAVAAWAVNRGSVEHEISFRPARVLMQDFTGVPAVVDLAAMRDAMTALGGNPDKINPLNPVDLVIDHSVMVDFFGNAKAFGANVDREYERNIERYNFLRWGSSAFNNFRVVPRRSIYHQVNLGTLPRPWTNDTRAKAAYPDTVVGTAATPPWSTACPYWAGRRRHRAEAARSASDPMLIPVSASAGGPARERPPIWCSPSPDPARAPIGKFVESSARARQPDIEDQATIANMAPELARPAASSPSPSRHRLPERPARRARRPGGPTPRSRACGSRPIRPGVHRHAGSDLADVQPVAGEATQDRCWSPGGGASGGLTPTSAGGRSPSGQVSESTIWAMATWSSPHHLVHRTSNSVLIAMASGQERRGKGLKSSRG